MIYIMIAAGIFAADYCIKRYVDLHRDEGVKSEALNGKIIINKIYNKGAMLGFGEKKQELITGVSLGVTLMLLITYLYMLCKEGCHLLKLGFSFILGGAASNVYDRIKRGKVVDYFSFNTKWSKLRSIVFNISDIFIIIGTVIILIWNIADSKNKK